MNLNQYLESFSPELQEKAKACKTPAELLKLADENDIELKPEALEAVSGGCGGSSSDSDSRNTCCPYCKSTNYYAPPAMQCSAAYKCSNCLAEFDEPMRLSGGAKGTW